MGRQFFYKTIQVFLVLVWLSAKLNAGEQPANTTLPADHSSKYSSTVEHGGEIELTGAHSFAGYPHQPGKKLSFQSWVVDHSGIFLSEKQGRLSVYTQNTRRSVHLLYIFPFHYFW